MDVSNSTGDSTGYRVIGSGGAAPRAEVAVLHKGTLQPNTYVRVELSELFDSCVIEFLPKGKDPITLKVSRLKRSGHERLLVSLVPNGNGVPKAVLHRRKD